jgi:hypothetical protein
MIPVPLDLSLFVQPRLSAGHGPSMPPGQAAGPGWFESSWDLRRGCEVSEGGAADARLRHWIEDFLGAQGSASPLAAGASSSAR